MARTTRSTATVQEKELKSVETATAAPPPRTKSKSKKRKRDVVLEHEDQPAAKIARPSTAVTDDHQDEKVDLDSADAPPLPTSANLVLDPSNAQEILDILEMVDTQGLLDRVFPLSTQPSESPDPPSDRSCSFRTLLQESSKHPLRVLRAAIQHLFPISSHSRSRSSTPGAQQLRFCNLALSLLDQVSQSAVSTSFDLESFLAPIDKDSPPSPLKRRKYALVQKLPSGEWWTSLNSDISSSQPGKEFRDVGTAYAELVAVLPTPSTSTLPSDIPTLGSYAPKKTPSSAKLPPAKHRYISRGSFLDYGPYASFAPTFEQEGREVGRFRLGEVLLAQRRSEERVKAVEKLRRKRLKEIHHQEMVVDDDSADQTCESPKQAAFIDDPEVSKGLLTKEQIDFIKSAFQDLDIETSAQEMLGHNAKALVRLEELQMERLGDKTGFRPVEVGSEEWDLAQAIKDSLAILMSLRPRSNADESLVPPASLLRKLYRTLPLNPSPGWHGNIPASRTSALRDDTTIHLKSGALSAAVDPSLTSRTGPTKPPVATPQYSTYPTSNYQTTVSYPTTSYGTYTPSQGSYYQNYSSSTTSYANQAYSSSWYGNYAHTQANSGRATPVPVTTTQPTMYQTPQPQRAVANTVLTPSTATKSHPGWTPSGTAGQALTLPAHMRNSVAGSTTPQPGTPGVYLQAPR